MPNPILDSLSEDEKEPTVIRLSETEWTTLYKKTASLPMQIHRFEDRIRSAVNDWQKGAVTERQFIERIVNARNELDMARAPRSETIPETKQ